MNESPTLRRFVLAQCLALVGGCWLSSPITADETKPSRDNAGNVSDPIRKTRPKDYGPGSGDFIRQKPSARDRAPVTPPTESRLSPDLKTYRPRSSPKSDIVINPDPTNPIIRRKWGEDSPADATLPANRRR